MKNITIEKYLQNSRYKIILNNESKLYQLDNEIIKLDETITTNRDLFNELPEKAKQKNISKHIFYMTYLINKSKELINQRKQLVNHLEAIKGY